MAGCIDRVTSLGSTYYADTVGFHTITLSDTAFMQMTEIQHPTISYEGLSYNLTNFSPLMIIGKVLPENPSGSNEQLESWGLIKFNPIPADSVTMVTGIRLLLKDLNYSYGNVSNSNEDFQVWIETNGKVSDSTNYLTQPLKLSDLADTVGSVDTVFYDTADHVLPISFNSPSSLALVKSWLSASSLAFVITPTQNNPALIMNNARGFGTTDNSVDDANSVPQLELTLNNGSIIDETPSMDEHLVMDNSPSLATLGEFTLRGGAGTREHISMNFSLPETAGLTQFTTINNAVLVLHLDQNNSRESDLGFDTVGPAIVQITAVGDTGAALIGFGYRDSSDVSAIRFQIRGLIEDWLRSPVNNFGLELRSGFVTRNVGGVNIGVEDNTLNRWTFYGQNYTGPNAAILRPQLILTYSNLH